MCTFFCDWICLAFNGEVRCQPIVIALNALMRCCIHLCLMKSLREFCSPKGDLHRDVRCDGESHQCMERDGFVKGMIAFQGVVRSLLQESRQGHANIKCVCRWPPFWIYVATHRSRHLEWADWISWLPVLELLVLYHHHLLLCGCVLVVGCMETRAHWRPSCH